MTVAKFNKGYLTRKKIIEEAEKKFYENGFIKTKVTDICKVANVKQGTFTYYFHTKEDIIKELYGELLMRCYSYVGDHYNKELRNIEKNIISVFLYYLAIFRDEKTTQFHYEVLIKESVGAYMGQNVVRIYKSFNHNLTEKESNDAVTADVGARRELALRLIRENGLNISDENIVDFTSTVHFVMARLFSIDETIVSKAIEKAIIFLHECDYPKLKFLIK